jgi:hypothetical protein
MCLVEQGTRCCNILNIPLVILLYMENFIGTCWHPSFDRDSAAAANRIQGWETGVALDQSVLSDA